VPERPHFQKKGPATTGAKPQGRGPLNVVGLFAGIGGIERGLARAGHRALLLCENEELAKAVLRQRFPTIPLQSEVRQLKKLPPGTELVAAGFPCQDLSQAGQTAGISGARSGLVGEVVRLIESAQTPWVLLENVPFMLQLGRGRAMEVIVGAFEDLGYKWAYRVVDTRSFGLPQRRRRVYFLASLTEDPRTVLFADDAGERQELRDHRQVGCGFYWTEGIRGLGWAVDAIPTLKGGSTLGIPSPPAILLPTGEVVKPDICDAERMQGFPINWTKPAETAGRKSFRWKLVGNAVSVPAAEWIGKRLNEPKPIKEFDVAPLKYGRPWPTSAWNVDGRREVVDASEWPKRFKRPNLVDFLRFEGEPLSRKATAGFLNRTEKGSLRFPDGFIDALRAHLRRMEARERHSGS
jgi:DNA (cytosine-5)-methyltransferase 1